MDWDKLEECVDQTFKTLRLAYDVDLLRRAVPSPMVAQDFWSIMIPHLYLPYDPEAYTFYGKLYDEVKYRVENRIGAIRDEKYRLLFMIKNLLEEKVKVPGVVVEGDIVDLRVFNEREALDTMEAFIETMDHGRRERQRCGLGW